MGRLLAARGIVLSWACVALTSCTQQTLTEKPAWSPARPASARPGAIEVEPSVDPAAPLIPYGALVRVRMVATNTSGIEDAREAIIFWPKLADLRTPPAGAAGCYACIGPLMERKASVVLTSGSLGVPDGVLAGLHVGDRLRFPSAPGPWANLNAAAPSSFGSLTREVRWEVLFACEADLREVTYAFTAVKQGMIALPDGPRVARWYEFHGCKDGQPPPPGLTFAGNASDISQRRPP